MFLRNHQVHHEVDVDGDVMLVMRMIMVHIMKIKMKKVSSQHDEAVIDGCDHP